MELQAKYNKTVIADMFMVLLPTQILSSATAALGGIINGLVIGNFLSDEALVALGFVTPLTAMLGAIASIISGGARVVCGNYMGRGDVKKLDKVFTVALILMLSVGIALSLIAFFLSTPLAILFGATGDTTAATALYIKGLAFGILPTIMVPGLMIFLQMLNRQNYAFYSVILLAVCNLIFSLGNAVWIKGGVFGMGLASSLSQFVTAVFLLRKFIGPKAILHYEKGGFEKSLCIELVKLGSPTALAAILYAVRNVVLNSSALAISGSVAVSALAIMNSAGGVLDAVNVGTGAVSLILASIFVGEKDEGSLRVLHSYSLKIGVILGLIKLAFIAVFGKWIVALFGAEGELVAFAYNALLFYGICMPINMITLSLVSPYQALGRVSFVNILYVFNAIVFPLGWVFILKGMIGIFAVWGCFAGAEVLTLILIACVSAKKLGHFPKSLYDMLFIKSELSCGKTMSVSIKAFNEVSGISEKIQIFCFSSRIDKKKSYAAGLCVEEMTRNALHNTKSKHSPSVDIFVSCEENNVTIRIRDNTTEFDPKTRLLAFDPCDPCKNIGIRIVSGMAKKMNYQSRFGMNVLSIEI